MTQDILRKLFFLIVFLPVCRAGGSFGDACSPGEKQAATSSKVDLVLDSLNQSIKQLKSYQAELKYTFSQPLLDSETVRKGALYYEKARKKSRLRINFQTLRQDDSPQQRYREEVLFDGLWLVRIDYQLKSVEYRQVAEANNPMDAFNWVSGELPIVGFTDPNDMRRNFYISLVEPAPAEHTSLTHLHLQVKSDSAYRENYSAVDIWLEKENHLPARILATSAQQEIFDIRLTQSKVNKELPRRIFEIETPPGFSKNVIPMKGEE